MPERVIRIQAAVDVDDEGVTRTIDDALALDGIIKILTPIGTNGSYTLPPCVISAVPESEDDEEDEPLSRHDHLLAGFLGEDIERVRLYNASPTFRHAIDTLVAMAPAWVEGMAVAAQDQDLRDRQQMRLMEQMPPGPIVIRDDGIDS